MKRLIIVMLAIVFTIGFAGCKKESKHGSHGGHGKFKTKIVSVSGLQVAIDLMNKENYTKMLKVMKIMEAAGANDSHSLLVTIISKDTMKLVKDAKVHFNVKIDGKANTGQEAKILSGGGMYHYGLLMDLKGKSHLEVTADIQTGGKTHKASANFHLH